MRPLKQLGRYAALRKVEFGFRIPSSDKGTQRFESQSRDRNGRRGATAY